MEVASLPREWQCRIFNIDRQIWHTHKYDENTLLTIVTARWGKLMTCLHIQCVSQIVWCSQDRMDSWGFEVKARTVLTSIFTCTLSFASRQVVGNWISKVHLHASAATGLCCDCMYVCIYWSGKGRLPQKDHIGAKIDWRVKLRANISILLCLES